MQRRTAMPSTIFVTGATGQTGGNVCEQLIQRGDHVRALVRSPDEASALSDVGVELVKGDIRDGDDVLRAAKGAEAAIHCAALLGGASQDLEDFKAVNMVGTANVLDAGKAHGMRRVVALSTATFLNLGTGVDFEEAPVLEKPPNDPYTVPKLAAFQEAHRRARLRRGIAAWPVSATCWSAGRRKASAPPAESIVPARSPESTIVSRISTIARIPRH